MPSYENSELSAQSDSKVKNSFKSNGNFGHGKATHTPGSWLTRAGLMTYLGPGVSVKCPGSECWMLQNFLYLWSI